MSTPSHLNLNRDSNRVQMSKMGTFFIIFFFLIHIFLGWAMLNNPWLSTVHAYLTLSLGCIWAAFGRRLERVVYIGAYITGAEVLWRMTHAHIFWEYGKYAFSLVFFISLIRRGAKRPFLPVLYFVLMLPSTFMFLGAYENLNEMRQQVSFNLSGPFSLAIAVLFFSKVSLTKEQLYRTIICLTGPASAIASVSSIFAFTREELYFRATSMKELSGGFGPNQVSAILGLAALCIFFFVMDSRGRRILRWFMYALGFWLASQCALTFSRGGVYMGVIGAIAVSFFMVRNKRLRNRLILSIVILLLSANYIVLPRLVAFTQGKIVERFMDTSVTHRESILSDDLRIWSDNPVGGVGPGRARHYRPSFHNPVSAHTEFSRLLAEHGIFGLGALLILCFLGLIAFRKMQDARGKALAGSMILWSLLHMAVYATRIVAPSFTFGFAFSRFIIPKVPAITRRPVRLRPDKSDMPHTKNNG